MYMHNIEKHEEIYFKYIILLSFVTLLIVIKWHLIVSEVHLICIYFSDNSLISLADKIKCYPHSRPISVKNQTICTG